MSERFDKALVEKMRDSLALHEEPYMLGAWEHFQKDKLGKANSYKRFWWIGLVAGISMLMASSLLFTDFSLDTVWYSMDEESIQGPYQNESKESPTSQEQALPDALAKETKPKKETKSATEGFLALESSAEQLSPESKKPGKIRLKASMTQAITTSFSTKSPLGEERYEGAQPWERNWHPDNPFFGTVMPFSLKTKDNTTIDFLSKNEGPSSIMKDKDRVKTSLYPDDYFPEDYQEPSSPSKWEWGVQLSSMVNNTLGGNMGTSPNLGAGFVTGYSIAKKLDLFAGLIYQRQNVGSNDGFYMASAASSRNQLDFAAPESAHMVSLDNAQGFSPTNTQQIIHLNNLDIPVNLRYRFIDRPGKIWFVTSGISSMAYFSERREVLHSSAGGWSMLRSDATASNQLYSQDYSGDNVFDLAGFLNLGFGYKHTLHPSLHLVIEPFYKYPLGHLTHQEIRFSQGGINLQLNFGQ